jgi:hypothetical protein
MQPIPEASTGPVLFGVVGLIVAINSRRVWFARLRAVFMGERLV